MKTLTENFFNSINQQPLQCERKSLRSLSSRLWLWVPGLCIHVKITLLTISRKIVHALKAAHAGLIALLLSTVSKVNRRIFVGLGLMGVVAPLSACFYLLFNRVDYVQGWYHVNYFHLFFILGPHLFLLSCMAGAFLLFPEGSQRAYILAVPSGYTIAKIIWLILATSNAEFWAVVPSSFIFIGALISVMLFLSLDWLAHNKFHREDAFDARLQKLIDLADDFDDSKFKSMVKNVWREKENFQKQF